MVYRWATVERVSTRVGIVWLIDKQRGVCDSQKAMPFSAEELRDLPDIISAPRFATYLQAKGGHVADALELYAWNAEVSAAFMVPLHLAEVAIRNAAAEAIQAVHGANWPWVNGFIRGLPRAHGRSYDAGTNLQAVAQVQPTVGKVVSELNFVFWEKVFTTSQDFKIWDQQLWAVLPGCPGIAGGMTVAQARAQVHADLHHVRKLRNRIAHHEPIFVRRLADDLAVVRRLIAWRRPEAANWMDKVERVSGLLAIQP